MIGGSDNHTGVISEREDNFFGEFANGLPSPERWKNPLLATKDGKPAGLGLAGTSCGPGRRVGAREHPRGDLGRAQAQGGLRHHGRPAGRARVRGLGLRAGGPRSPRLRGERLRPRRADGRQSQQGAGRQATRLHGLRAARSGRPQPRPHPDHQGLARARTASRRSASSTWRSPAAARSARMAAARLRWATRWTWPTRPTPTPSAPPLLSAYWKDPTFDPTQRAFYYVRVIQIPSPRWTAYDQKRFGIKMADNVPMTVTDRAYTSPIWYTPVSCTPLPPSTSRAPFPGVTRR